ncbi:hypothetical protein AVEN_141485-1 [Araneus ventricosus]|uniref:Uncharacterized protein n=1 Tax=Araneus ventricosus TaxID=182803 RepID=A0A4Y1ZTI6_ARAVE|nr:hypothetical protein AVEN_141485-1 [Araneus ventricosus]
MILTKQIFKLLSHYVSILHILDICTSLYILSLRPKPIYIYLKRRLIIPKQLQEKITLSFVSNVGSFGLTQGHAHGKLAARVGVSVGIGISSSVHRHVYPLTSFLPVQVIQMSQHREALSSVMGSSPLVLHGVTGSSDLA